MLGTIVNVCTISLGSILGSLLRKGIKESYQNALYTAMGLAACAIGMNGVASHMGKCEYPVLFIVSLALGGIVGTRLDLSGRLDRMNQRLNRRQGSEQNALQGLMTGVLLYCIGTFSIVGPVLSCLSPSQGWALAEPANTYLYTNATLDLVTSAVLSATYGWVMLLAAPVLFCWQGMFYLIAYLCGEGMPEPMRVELSIVGGVLIVSSGLSILGIKDCKTVNLLPSLLVPVLFFLFGTSRAAAQDSGTARALAPDFETCFEDSTLRLDYIMAGNAEEQHIYLSQMGRQGGWAGRRSHLDERPLAGNGQLTVRDHETQQVVYVWTFSTLFQEWLLEEEAKHVSRAFEASYNVPFPRRKVDVTVTLTDHHQREVASLTHTVDPQDILIRSLDGTDIPHYYVWKGGDVADCVDLAIVAEGYTAGEMDKFRNDCQRAVGALFEHEPFASLRDRFNVVAVAAPSQQSGPSVPHEGQWSHTAVGTHYDTFYSERYLTSQHMHRIYDLLQGVPFEHIMVLVNTDRYGGGGIYNQITFASSDHPTFAEVFVHEFGHSYGGLADEYAYDDMDTEWYPADVEPWEPNITTLHDFGQKWADLLPAGQPVPTPPDPSVPDYRKARGDDEALARLNACTQVVGVFEGAGYQSHGCYRPAQECRMKVNEVRDFCPVCTRAIRRITEFYTKR